MNNYEMTLLAFNKKIEIYLTQLNKIKNEIKFDKNKRIKLINKTLINELRIEINNFIFSNYKNIHQKYVLEFDRIKRLAREKYLFHKQEINNYYFLNIVKITDQNELHKLKDHKNHLVLENKKHYNELINKYKDNILKSIFYEEDLLKKVNDNKTPFKFKIYKFIELLKYEKYIILIIIIFLIFLIYLFFFF